MIKMLIANLKMMLRGKQALFWSLAFPLMFTIIFGFFFGGGSAGVGTVALINRSDSEIAKNLEQGLEGTDIFKIRKETDEELSRDLLKKNQVGAIVVIPEKFGELSPDASREVKIINDPANAQVNSAVTGYLNAYLTQVDYRINRITPMFTINEERTNQRTLNYFDFVLMGLLGLALMNSSIQGIAIAMAKYRDDKILKRITTTPLRSWKFVSAEVISRLLINVVQVTMILAVGYYAFDAHIYGNIWLIYLFSLLGALLFQSIGFMVASISKTMEAAEGLSIFISIPMMFLAGVFFPIDQLPRWLFSLVQYLPLAPLLRMIRTIGLEDASPLINPINLIIVLAWIIIGLTISVWKFRLAEE